MAPISRIAALAALSLLAVACGGTRSPNAGRASPRQAVSAFLEAAKAKDVDGMALVWGTAQGPSADFMDRDQREKRILIIQCHLAHDRAQVVGEYPGDNGRRVFRVALSLGTTSAETTVQAVQGPGERWFVESADIEKTSELCRLAGVGQTSKP